MEVWAGGAASGTGPCDDVPGLHSLSHLGQQLGVVAIQSSQAAAVVDHHIVAVASLVVGSHGHRPRQRRPDGRAGGDGQIHAGVSPALAGEGIDPVSELRGDHRLPPSPDGGAEAVRTDEGHLRTGKPAGPRSSCGTVDHQVVDAVGVGPVFLRDFNVQDFADLPVDFHIPAGFLAHSVNHFVV